MAKKEFSRASFPLAALGANFEDWRLSESGSLAKCKATAAKTPTIDKTKAAVLLTVHILAVRDPTSQAAGMSTSSAHHTRLHLRIESHKGRTENKQH